MLKMRMRSQTFQAGSEARPMSIEKTPESARERALAGATPAGWERSIAVVSGVVFVISLFFPLIAGLSLGQ